MARVIMAAAVWVVIVGGVGLYMNRRVDAPPVQAVETREAQGSYTLEVTPSFAAETDPFALTTDTSASPAALRVLVNGQVALERESEVAGGQPIRVDDVPGLIEGGNEFYVEANPPLSEGSRSHAVRVRILCDGEALAEHSLWSEEGGRIAATFRLAIEAAASQDKEADHDH